MDRHLQNNKPFFLGGYYFLWKNALIVESETVIIETKKLTGFLCFQLFLCFSETAHF